MSLFIARYWPLILLQLILLFGAGLIGHAIGTWDVAELEAEIAAERAEMAEAVRQAEADAREAERQATQRIAEVAQQYEQEKRDAQDAADRVVADLRAGNLRLHQRWQAALATGELSRAATAAGEPDAAADDRIESAGRIVRAAAECDAQVRGLQAVIRADRSD